MDPIRLLAQADLFLWIVGLLRSRPSAKSQAIPREDLDLLIRRSFVDGSWDGSKLSRIQTDLANLITETVSIELTRLFEGATACPINETAYVRRDKGVILADLTGFYRAFGFTTSRVSGEKPDHVITEIEFLSVLLVMLARAEMERDEEKAAVTEDALVDFCQDHIGEWIEAFCERLAATASLRSIEQCSLLLRDTWVSLRRHLGLEVPARARRPMPEDEVSSPYECGLSDEPAVKPRTNSSA